MSRRHRRRKPQPLEALNWAHWILNHCWDRTPRNEVRHQRLLDLQALTQDFLADHPDAVPAAIAEARVKHNDPGLEEVFEVLHPALKKYATEHGIELTDFDPSPY